MAEVVMVVACREFEQAVVVCHVDVGIANDDIGVANIIVGDPNVQEAINNSLFKNRDIRAPIYHFRHYALYQLIDPATGFVWKAGPSAGFCMLDSDPVPISTAPSRRGARSSETAAP